MSVNISTLYFSNIPFSNTITGIHNETLTQDDISNNTFPFSHTLADISGITIGTDVEKLEDYLFTDCSNLSNIVIYNTDNLFYIGNHLFDDVSNNGHYSFYSKIATNDTNKTYYYTPNVQRLETLLKDVKPNWVSDLSYTYYTNFGILCNEMTHINKNTADYYDFAPIDISYVDFHTMFFKNNGYFNLTPCNYVKKYITKYNLDRYTIINNQTLEVYSLSDVLTDISFNLYSCVMNHYQSDFPSQCWSIESTMKINKQLTKLKTIYDFYNNLSCNQPVSNCNTCNYKNNTKLTLDDMFNIWEEQGVTMATDNSYNSIDSTLTHALGLPLNANYTKYIAILNVYLRSNNSNVKDISLRMPYRINFSSSMPTNSDPNTNNYRYNPSF